MPNDAYTLGFLTNELNNLLKGGKINKISQPNSFEVVLYIYANSKNFKLCINLNGNSAKIYLTDSVKDNPLSAFSFLMNLRKHLNNSQIIKIENVYCERILIFEFLNKSEFNEQTYKLYAELTGKNANIILTQDNKILAALKSYPLDNNVRAVFAGLQYEPPKSQDNFCLNETRKIENALKTFNGENLESFLLKILKGVSASTVQEIIYLSGVKSQNFLSQKDIQNLSDTIKKFDDIQKNSLSSPVLALKDDKPSDAFAFLYKSQNLKFIGTKSLSDAFTKVYDKIDDGFYLSQTAKPLRQIVKNNINKLTKKIKILNENLTECENSQKYKISGELITANIYKIQKNDKALKCLNYYDNKEAEIPLDPRLTPSQNAQSYFKKYNKLKKAKAHADEQLIKAKDDLEYFLNLETALNLAAENSDFEQIKSELVKLGLIAEKKQKSKKPPEIKLTKYETEGFTILAGKNNIQNDYLTFKIAKPNDVWLHVKDAFGAHVIIVYDNKEIPESVLIKAGEIAAYFSGQKESEKVSVDYTLKKFIKKPPSVKPGFVTYTNYKTILVKPNQNIEFIIN